MVLGFGKKNWLVLLLCSCRHLQDVITLLWKRKSHISNVFCFVTGIAFSILGALLFMPGFYYTRIAYYAYKGYKGFSFSNIPAVWHSSSTQWKPTLFVLCMYWFVSVWMPHALEMKASRVIKQKMGDQVLLYYWSDILLPFIDDAMRSFHLKR